MRRIFLEHGRPSVRENFPLSQPLNFDNGHEEPVINLGWAIVIFALMILGITALIQKI